MREQVINYDEDARIVREAMRDELTSLRALNRELVEKGTRMLDAWLSVCFHQGWDPWHKLEAVDFDEILAKARGE
jgi:hypothetical protein